MDGCNHQDLGYGIVLAIRVLPDDEGKLLHSLCNDLGIGIEHHLTVVGPQAEDDQIQGTMAVEHDGKVFQAAPVLFKGIIKDCRASSKALLYDAIPLAQGLGQEASPPLFKRPTPTAGVGTEEIGVAKAKYVFHHLSSNQAIEGKCNESTRFGQTTFLDS